MNATRSSATLRAAIAADLARSGAHRLLREMSDGSVSAAAFGRYLAFEEAFVATAVRVTGYCVWAEPDWVRSRRHAETLRQLADEQLGYFAEVRRRWTIADADAADALRRAAVLSDHILAAVGDHGYPGAIAAMFAAETLYSDWCGRAAGLPAGLAADVEEWIMLHTAPAFLDGVAFLAELVDGLADTVSDETLAAWARAMLYAEDAFHSAAYPAGAA